MKKRQELHGFLLRILICVLAVITVAYAWFNYDNKYEGPAVQYQKKLIISTQDLTVNTYCGSETDGEVIYDNEPATQTHPFDVTTFPGFKQYFRTDVTNNTSNADAYVSLYLQNVVYDSLLEDYIYVGVVSPVAMYKNYKENAADLLDSNGVAVAGKRMMDGAQITDGLNIPAGDTVSVYWYIYIDTDLDNSGIGKTINLEKMNILYS